MTCKLDHTDPDGIPAFLCRACNPGLNMVNMDRLRTEATDAADKRRSLAQARLTRRINSVRSRLMQIEGMQRKGKERSQLEQELSALELEELLI